MRKLAIWASGLLLILSATAVTLSADTLSGNQQDPLNVCREGLRPDGTRTTTCLVFDPQEKVASAPINTVHEITVKLEVTAYNPDGSVKPGYPAPPPCTGTAPDGQPIDLEILMIVYSGPNKDTHDKGNCDEHGRFTMSYAGDSGPGRDLILACIYASGTTPPPDFPLLKCLDKLPSQPDREGPFATAEVTWVDATPPPQTAKPTVTPPTAGGKCYTLPAGGKEETWCISLDPETSSTAVGTEQSLDVTLTLDGSPQSGEFVALEIVGGPNSGILVSARNGATIQLTDTASGDTSGTDGRTALFYVGSGGLGTDTIRACRAVVPPTGCSAVVDEATVNWTEAPPGALGAQQAPQPGGTGTTPNQLQGGPNAGIGSLAPLPNNIPLWPPVAGGIATVGLLVASTLLWRSRRRGRGRGP
jgi:hypothetical protein